MKDSVFLDTNILIYLYSQDEPNKKSMVKEIFNKHANILISTQVLNEMACVLSKKIKMLFDQIDNIFDEILNACVLVIVDKEIIKKALHVASQYHFSYFDSLMVAAALQSDCIILYSEDLHHKQKIKRIMTIVNPFN